MRIEKETQLAINLASNFLKQGKLVSIMTETVYGLLADAKNSFAVKKIYRLKNRPTNNPLIIHVNSLEMAKKIAIFSDDAENLVKKFWPGPLTVILKKRTPQSVCSESTANLDTIAIRMPDSKIFQKIISKINKPIAAPSANVSGFISSTKASHVCDCFGDKIDLVIDSGQSKYGLESTILNMEKKPFEILRLGIIDQKDIQKVTSIKINQKILYSEKINAPGQLKKHYSPKTPVRLNVVKPKFDEAFLAFGKLKFKNNDNSLNLSYTGNLNEAAFNLFDYLRKLDKLKKRKIAVSRIPSKGLGKVINERLRRAVSGN